MRHLATPAWRIHARAERGKVRRTMQDAFAVLPDAPAAWRKCDAIAVFDGVGGLAHGAEAAGAAAAGLHEAVRLAVSPADIFAHLQNQVRATKGATTAVLALLPRSGGTGDLVWTGDSSAYGVDAEGGLAPLAAHDSEDGFLTQCLGLDGMAPHTARIEVRPGQAVLLCTDGVDGVVGRLPLHRLLQGPASADAALLDQVFAAVAAAGAPDNATLVLARRM